MNNFTGLFSRPVSAPKNAIPEDPYALLQWDLIRVQGIFKSAYDRIISLLDNPPEEDILNVLGYIMSFVAAIEAQHHTQETIIFPFFRPKLDFTAEMDAHEIIESRLGHIASHVLAAHSDQSLFDAGDMKQAVMDLYDPLLTHLDEEATHLQPDNIRKYPLVKLQEMLVSANKYMETSGDPYVILPFFASHTPPEWQGVWPHGMLWRQRNVTIPYVYGARYAGYWKYSPYILGVALPTLPTLPALPALPALPVLPQVPWRTNRPAL